MSKWTLSLILLALVVSFLASLVPETGFDALWYHLTIPKLYLQNGGVYHIPGGLLYYSEMPRLIEILYVPLLKYFGYVGPHLLNWLSGIGSALVIYLLARKYLDKSYAVLAVVIFYVTPLVGWTSGSAYVDLPRTFFEILTVYLLFERKILLAGLIFGLAISTKTLALGSYLPLLAVMYLLKSTQKNIASFFIVSLIIGLPWFLSAFIGTGYPFYPIGAGILDTNHALPISQPNAFINIFTDLWKVFIYPEDVISPIFVLLVPFIFVIFTKMTREIRILTVYMLLSYVVWWMIPRTGGGRFILPYLPVWAIVCASTISLQKDNLIRNLLLAVVILVAVFNLGYRVFALKKSLPFLTGKQTATEYLCTHLDFSISTFVDCDGFLARNIIPSDRLLVIGVHNLFYLDVPYIHETWYKGEEFNKILTQNSDIPDKFKSNKWHLVYSNMLTRVKLYSL